ncbi:Uronate isomerase [Cognatishimia activa]|uniref:Uronate isomerase n=1 Tax=Cognatishimia activa TaxID=1715691 RepID=A0A0P1IVA2_9RHOB|nr:glucuronate isomerase [Cognatishimia activa]CUK27493.1 Uronate isomerase [Cognatishimia activa]
MNLLDEDRLFPVETRTKDIARELYLSVKSLPIISPHGHTQPIWFAKNEPFANPAELFVTPDHYVFRMLFSQGVRLEDLGIQRLDGADVETDPRKIWQLFADHYYLFRGTPSQLWIDYSLQEVFGVTEPLSTATAPAIYDHIDACLKQDAFRPRALFDRFNIELLATTEGPLDSLEHHDTIMESDWNGRIVTTYRPDAVVDPDAVGFKANVEKFGALVNEDATQWEGYLDAHRKHRVAFKKRGATASDHGHPTAQTANLSEADKRALFARVLQANVSAEDAELFRAQMLTEMARMSLDDGLVMQIHPGARRNHNRAMFDQYGPDKGFDVPGRTDYVQALRPLLDAHGLEPNLQIILFTLDETSYARELAPLAGVYPCLKLGPPWWFHDSPEGMMRFRQMATETAGFYNTAGFNDDTRAFCSIPARHDVARRVDSAFLAGLVTAGRLRESEAADLIHDLTYRLAKKAYRL